MEEPDEQPNLPWDAWPCCPRCQLPRQAICPICQTAGTDFSLADYQLAPAPLLPVTGTATPATATAAETPLFPLLHCRTCDEVFRPRFYARCHACGYDFREGLAVESAAFDGLASRVQLVVLSLLATAAVLVLYFWWLLRR